MEQTAKLEGDSGCVTVSSVVLQETETDILTNIDAESNHVTEYTESGIMTCSVMNQAEGLESRVIVDSEAEQEHRDCRVTEAGGVMCEVCGRVFQKRNQLRTHRHRVHTNNNLPAPCTDCGKLFKTRESLAEHAKRHLEDKPWTCPVCEEGFALLSHLHDHLKNMHFPHLQKKYRCEACSVSFRTASDLSRHKLFKHSEGAARPYMCAQCHKGFITNGDLVKHSRVHSGVRPYKCEVCGRGFSQLGNMRSHRNTHNAIT